MTHDYVKINYKGKDYIGQISSIEGIYYDDYNFNTHDNEKCPVEYKISMYEKGTFCLISDIIIRSFAEIELLPEDEV